jgi:YVTN family beta-propeller protein
MVRVPARLPLAALACAFVLFAASGATAQPGYRLTKTVLLGGDTFWDYLKIDAAARRLYITHGTHVVVVDADTTAVVGDIPNTQGVHGVAIADDLSRGFASDGTDNTVTVFDTHTLANVGRVYTGVKPDAIVYEPTTHLVFTFNGGSGDSTAIDAATLRVTGTVPLAGKPEFAAVDGHGMVFVNIEDKSELVAIDARTLKITARWPLAPCVEPSGLSIDAEHGRLFSGCHNNTMAVMNDKTGAIVATLPIGKGVDATRYDPGTGLAFASNGDGTLTVIHEDSSDKFSVTGNVTTQMGARTMEVDPQTHNVFLVTADLTKVTPTPASPRGFAMVPGSFRLLVYSGP